MLTKFSSNGYWFDKVVTVSYDSNEEITRQLNEVKNYYDNAIILHPDEMAETLKKYLQNQYATTFVYNQISSGGKTLFLISNAQSLSLVAEEVIKSLNAKYSVKYQKSYIKTVGASKTEINTAIAKAKNISSDLEFNVYGEYGDDTIEILYTDKTTKMVLDGVIRIFVTLLGEYVYALENVTLAERLYQLLTLRRMKIAVAESFTGGGVGQKLVEVPGISQVFYEGLNTYSNQSKIQRLGVEESTISHHGAVSDETAYQMAAGLISQGNCDISIATTGIAGPKSDNTNKPVGLCYIAIGLKESVFVYKYVLNGNRERITKTAINYALFLAYKQIK
ncbi:MAG: CinA family protein [Clostridia bacterium]|nr:CinA family protein [Clostridia bacterium]